MIMLLSRYPVMGKIYEVLIRRINPEIRSYDKWEVDQPHLKGTIEISGDRARGSVRYDRGWTINFNDGINTIFITKTRYVTKKISYDIKIINSESRKICVEPKKVYYIFNELIKRYPHSKCDFVQLGTGYILTRKKKKKKHE